MNINFCCTSGLLAGNGYGKMGIALIRELHERGFGIRISGYMYMDSLQYVPELVRRRTLLNTNPVGVTLVTGSPHLPRDVQGTTAVLYTMSESTKISDQWVQAINERFKAVIVSAPELVDIYRACGVRVKCHYIALGVEPPSEDLTGLKRTRKVDSDHPFTFLTYSLGEMRKGADVALLAFKRAFGGRSEYKLQIKTRRRAGTWLAGVDDNQIEVVEGDLSDQEWYRLLAQADCFVFPSRGEGYGLPPREAVLAGTPTIATAWLGLWDVAQWGLPIQIAEMRPAMFEVVGANAADSQWAEPDIDHLIVQMHRAAKGDHRSLVERGQRYLRNHADWANTAKQVAEVLENYR